MSRRDIVLSLDQQEAVIHSLYCISPSPGGHEYIQYGDKKFIVLVLRPLCGTVWKKRGRS